MTPDQFRQPIREGFKGEAFAYGVRTIIREELAPLKDAMLVIADHLPGSVPRVTSYVRKRVEQALGAAGG